jgi:hypothetical protein
MNSYRQTFRVCRDDPDRHHENNYTVTKGKKCNEKSFSRDAHPDTGVSFQMQLLLEFGGEIADHEHRDNQGSGGMAKKFP